MSKVTMQTVAAAAGVSRMTVSRALRDCPKIPIATRERIQRLAAELNYRPDPLIQRLATHLGESRRAPYTGTLAWITDWSNDAWKASPTILAMYRGAQERATSQGYALDSFNLREPGMTGKRLSQILDHRAIQGLILAPISHGGGHMRLDWRRFSFVALGYSMRRPLVHRAANHHLHSVRVALRELSRRGYRRIGLCVSSETNARSDNCYLDAFLAYQPSLPCDQRVTPFNPKTTRKDDLLAWLSKEKPDCIVAVDPLIADMIANAGLKIPADIGFLLLDWPAGRPHMAGIDQQHNLVGSLAVDMLVGQVYRNERGIPETPRTMLIESRWQEGNSILRRA
ncbi:LacI family transcriptional regulator [Verrucomicrobia bacterium LW23]|nr:LacI family transcriptional regulator [Verrucomicrobia bacterium LW23]